eukprot:76087-Rhodomonas_salina.7
MCSDLPVADVRDSDWRCCYQGFRRRGRYGQARTRKGCSGLGATSIREGCVGSGHDKVGLASTRASHNGDD